MRHTTWQTSRQENQRDAPSPSETTHTDGLELTMFTRFNLNDFISELCHVVHEQNSKKISKSILYTYQTKELPKQEDSNKAQLALINLLRLTIQCQKSLQLYTTTVYPLGRLYESRDYLNVSIESTDKTISREDNIRKTIQEIFSAVESMHDSKKDGEAEQQPTLNIVEKTILSTTKALDEKIKQRESEVKNQRSEITKLEVTTPSESDSDGRADSKPKYTSTVKNTQSNIASLNELRGHLLPENKDIFNQALCRNKLASIAANYLKDYPQPTYKLNFFPTHTRQRDALQLLDCTLSEPAAQKSMIINAILKFLKIDDDPDTELQSMKDKMTTNLRQYDMTSLLKTLALTAYAAEQTGYLHETIKHVFQMVIYPFDKLFTRRLRECAHSHGAASPNYGAWIKSELVRRLETDHTKTYSLLNFLKKTDSTTGHQAAAKSPIAAR